MTPFKILSCPNYLSINSEITSYLEQHTELLTKGAKLYANFIDIKKFELVIYSSRHFKIVLILLS